MPRLVVLLALAACTPEDPVPEGIIAWPPHTDLDLRDATGAPADVADPHVIRVGDTWYLYGTHSFVDLEAWSSTDLATWTWEGVVWRPTPGSWNDHPTIWAPHVEPVEEGFVLYYSANGRVGAARAATPAGPFVDVQPGPLVGGGAGGVGDGVYVSEGYDVEDPADFVADAEEYALDPFLLRQEDGTLTLWISRLVPWSAIAVVPMTDPVTPTGAEPQVVLTVDPEVPWEGLNREGPWVMEQDGRLILTYSGSYWWTTDYAIGAATSASVAGPFVRQSDEPLLATDEALGTLGPGHHSVASDGEGGWLIFFHNKVSEEPYSSRRTRYARLFVEADGTLRVGGLDDR